MLAVVFHLLLVSTAYASYINKDGEKYDDETATPPHIRMLPFSEKEHHDSTVYEEENGFEHQTAADHPPLRKLAPIGLTCIDFDDFTAEHTFDKTTPLTDRYAAYGVTFSGPSPTQGAAVLTDSSFIGFSGQSSPNILAWNFDSLTGYPVLPETFTFDVPIDYIELKIAGRGDGSEATLECFLGTVSIVTLTTTLGLNLQTLQFDGTAAGEMFNRCVVTTSDSNSGMMDDLCFRVFDCGLAIADLKTCLDDEISLCETEIASYTTACLDQVCFDVTEAPSAGPSTIPSAEPSAGPSTIPSDEPSARPSAGPSSGPTEGMDAIVECNDSPQANLCDPNDSSKGYNYCFLHVNSDGPHYHQKCLAKESDAIALDNQSDYRFEGCGCCADIPRLKNDGISLKVKSSKALACPAGDGIFVRNRALSSDKEKGSSKHGLRLRM